jgi:hypothetical protein
MVILNFYDCQLLWISRCFQQALLPEVKYRDIFKLYYSQTMLSLICVDKGYVV